MRMVIAGGGTGGHLFPGIAIATEFMSRESHNEVLFVGTREGIEERIVPAEGFKIRFIRASGIVNVGFWKKLKGLMRIPKGIMEARTILESFDPHVVLGVGGYASGPVVAAARWMGFPTVIHEQNAVPGLTNRILGSMVDVVCLAYPDVRNLFKSGQTFLTGNPVRKTMRPINRKQARETLGLETDRFTVFVLGGSRGAHSLNRAMVEALPHLDALRGKFQVIHQTGARDEEEIKALYRKDQVTGLVSAFFQKIELPYGAADLVIGRAGASTVAELAEVARGAVLVPYPHAAKNHQEVNARRLVDLGACRMILEADLTGERLAREILFLWQHPQVLTQIETSCRSMSRPRSAAKIVDIVYELCKRRGVL